MFVLGILEAFSLVAWASNMVRFYCQFYGKHSCLPRIRNNLDIWCQVDTVVKFCQIFHWALYLSNLSWCLCSIANPIWWERFPNPATFSFHACKIFVISIVVRCSLYPTPFWWENASKSSLLIFHFILQFSVFYFDRSHSSPKWMISY